MRLLFVEDDSRIVSFVSKGLKEASFVVMHAADGRSGLRLALEGSYDAAIIDIMLPGMDGLALIEELRGRRIRLPVIILSAK
ncbi:MAG: response regulator, partial [Methylococcales bacterium]